MEERIIIEGKNKAKQIFKTVISVGAAIVIFALILCAVRLNTGEIYKSFYGMYMPYTQAGFNFFDLLFCGICFELEAAVGVLIYLGVLVILVSVFLNAMMSKCAITLTERRIVGKSAFGKPADISINQISSISKGAFLSISVSVASKSFSFWCIENRDEVFNNLAYMIQTRRVSTPTPQLAGRADELKKYKELLDIGAMTQEEFDAIKKQILGL